MQRMLAFYPNNTKLVEEVKTVTTFHEQKKAELTELKTGLEALAADAPERAATEVCRATRTACVPHRPPTPSTLTHAFILPNTPVPVPVGASGGGQG